MTEEAKAPKAPQFTRVDAFIEVIKAGGTKAELFAAMGQVYRRETGKKIRPSEDQFWTRAFVSLLVKLGHVEFETDGTYRLKAVAAPTPTQGKASSKKKATAAATAPEAPPEAPFTNPEPPETPGAEAAA